MIGPATADRGSRGIRDQPRNPPKSTEKRVRINFPFPCPCPSRGRAHARRVGSPARRVGSFRGCPFVMIFLAVVIPDEDHGIGFVFACTSAEIEPKTIVAYGLTFSCRLALFAPFSNFAAPVAARWHCTAPTTELRKTHSEFAPSRPRSFMQIQISGMPNRCGMTVGQPFLSRSFQSPVGVCRLSRRCRRTR